MAMLRDAVKAFVAGDVTLARDVLGREDEVDALRAIGMDPVEVLVLPRIFGLVIALPALTVVADAMGLAGGALLSW